MTTSRLRLGAGSFAVGAILVLAGRALSRRKGPAVAVSSGRTTSVPLAAPPVSAVPGEHVPTDLQRASHPGFADRAVDAFRPDPTAPISPEEREALRPAPPLQTAAQAVADSDRAEAV